MMKLVQDANLRRRLLFILTNVAISAAIVGGMVMPVHGFFADRESRLVDQLQALARLNAIAAQAANVQSITSDTSAQMRGGEFLTGPNENVIGADLQTRLKAMTEGAGAKSRAVQALPPKTIDQIKYSGSRIEIFGSLQSIQRAVYAIEAAKPYLFVDSAAIRITPALGRPAVTEEPVIQAQLDIFGAMLITGREP